MDFLGNLFSGPPGAGQEFLILALVFGVVLLMGIGVMVLVGDSDVLRRRLEAAPDASERVMSSGASIRFTAADRPFLKFMMKVGERIGAKALDEEGRTNALRQHLVQAGYFAPSAVSVFFAVRVILGIGMPVLFSLVASFWSTAMETRQLLGIAGALALIGAYAPNAWVSLRVRGRQRAAREGFPDTLDMLLICVEAGLGLDAAIDRVGIEVNRAHPIVAMQFAMLSAELRAGRRREDALRNLSERIGIEEVGSLVTLLVQSEKFGTSLAQTLRVHADEMRVKRMLKAEEKAAMLPVLLSVPLVLCILPALLTVVMTPAIIRVMRQLIPTLGGG
jgi:tight adherence protein C